MPLVQVGDCNGDGDDSWCPSWEQEAGEQITQQNQLHTQMALLDDLGNGTVERSGKRQDVDLLYM